MDVMALCALFISFVVTALQGPFVIPYLRKLKVGQTVRDDGPKSHLKKNGTPTMGGIMFLTGTLITSLFFVKKSPEIIPVLMMTVGFGLIGFIDEVTLLRALEGRVEL